MHPPQAAPMALASVTMPDSPSATPHDPAFPSPRLRYLLAALACGVTTVATTLLHDWLAPVNAVMLYLVAVVLIASRLGRGPAIMASFLSVGLFDFFLVPPRFSFAIGDIQYLLTVAVMLSVALLISHLTHSLRLQAEAARQTARRAQALSALAHQLAGALTVEQAVAWAEAFAHDELHARLTLWVPDAEHGLRRLHGPGSTELQWLALSAMRQGGHPHPQHTADDAGHHVLLPLKGATRHRGVLGLTHARSAGLRAHEDLVDALGALLSTTLERLHFVEVAHHTELDMQQERLRSSILSALSHDIRTPLTALVGLADTLSLIKPSPTGQALELTESLRGQALRLHRMVSNLLDMARLQRGQRQGALPLRREWQPIEEVIGASIQLLGTALARHRVVVDLPADLPLVQLDAVLMERVFGNLLENAAKYAPPDTDIALRVRAQGAHLDVCVANAGAGFPRERLAQLFELFERGEHESSVPGMGLGLAICKVIVEAHGGHIEARVPDAGGAEVHFTLPLGQPPVLDPEPTEEPRP